MAPGEHLRRGPKVGDAASLWNFAPSPGWTKEETYILKLCLQKYGVGKWKEIQESGFLPGKLIQQLNGQTQRLLGQQSLAAYTGLLVDIDRIRADNEEKKDVERKGGLIIWSGPNPTKAMKAQWRKEAEAKYGMTQEQVAEVKELLADLEPKGAGGAGVAAIKAAHNAAAEDFELMGTELGGLSHASKCALLRQLHRKLQQVLALVAEHNLVLQVPEGMVLEAQQPDPAPAAAPAAAADAPAAGEDAAPAGQADVLTEATNKPLSACAGAAPPAADAKPKAQRGSGGGRSAKRKSDAAGKSTAAKRGARGKAKVVDESGDEGEAGGGGGGAVVSEALAEIMAMGFTKAKARDALDMAGGDVQSAMEWLLGACCG